MTSDMPRPDMESSIWIARAPEDTWNFFSVISTDTQWRTGVTDAEWISEPPHGVGSTGLYIIEGIGDWPWKVPEFLSERAAGSRKFIFDLAADEQALFSHHTDKDTLLLPSLKTFMNHTAGNAKPVSVNRFPLAAAPQDVPDSIQSSSIIGPRMAWPSPLRRGWQNLSGCFPQFVGHFEAIDIFRFCDIILTQDASSLGLVVGNSIIQQERLFC